MDWMQIAFSPRKLNITLYLTEEVVKLDLIEKLGKNECGKGCLYIKKLSHVDVPDAQEADAGDGEAAESGYAVCSTCCITP